MVGQVVYMKDFKEKKTEERIIEAIDRSEEASGCGDFYNAREFYWTAHNIYAESKKEISHISNRMNDLEQDLFFR